MSGFQDYIAEDRRLCILRLLAECGGTANESVLHTGLEHLGFVRLPRQTIREDIEFLLKAMLVRTEWFQTVLVASVTERGIDAAEGRIRVPGIKPPSIGV